ncbi:hypothetical protein, conserved [Angomonas deanei]|uniref:RING-type domain-containing protein n=1 Tax=Angomonas deanei TaxID=59799 RepID=A0A7G2CDC3_9TRYP|nr:hypothetical protein, conserved [Angomonas deanei]
MADCFIIAVLVVVFLSISCRAAENAGLSGSVSIFNPQDNSGEALSVSRSNLFLDFDHADVNCALRRNSSEERVRTQANRCLPQDIAKCEKRNLICRITSDDAGVASTECVTDKCAATSDYDSCVHQNECGWCCKARRCVSRDVDCYGDEKFIGPQRSCASICSYASTCQQCLETYTDFGCVWYCESQMCAPSSIESPFYRGAKVVTGKKCDSCLSGLWKGRKWGGFFRAVGVVLLFMFDCVSITYATCMIAIVSLEGTGDAEDTSEEKKRQAEIRRYGFLQNTKAPSAPVSTRSKQTKQRREARVSSTCDHCSKPILLGEVVESILFNVPLVEDRYNLSDTLSVLILPCKHLYCYPCASVMLRKGPDSKVRKLRKARYALNPFEESHCPLCGEFIRDFTMTTHIKTA